MKKSLFLFLIFTIPQLTFTQDAGDHIFDYSVLHEVRLSYPEDNFFYLLSSNYDNTPEESPVPYLMCDVSIDGERVDSIGVRLKGFSSYFFAETDKKPIKLDFNEYVPGKKYDGLRKLNLNNSFGDPAMQRDFIAYELLRKNGVKAPRTAYAKVYLNDIYWGVYLLVEQVDREFLQRNFSNADGNLFKNKAWSKHEWLGDDPEDYSPPFELKTNEAINDWSGLVHFTDLLNISSNAEFPEAIQEVFDVDLFLKTLAVDVATNNWDSYLEHGRNWYIYEDTLSGIFHWIPWDYNFSLGGGFDFGSVDDFGFAIDQKSNEGVLIRRLLRVPDFRAKYFQYFCELLYTDFTEEQLFPLMEKNGALIKAAIADDPGYFYSLADYEEDIGESQNERSLKSYISRRIDTLTLEIQDYANCADFLTDLSFQEVVINEFMASNDSLSRIADADGEYDDWIELYNTTSSSVDLSGVYFSDDLANPEKWSFPAGTTIEPDDYLIVWADEDGGQTGLHCNFKLSKAGEALILSNTDGSVIDSVSFGEQATNIAAARIPNGSGPFVAKGATFSYNNDLTSSVGEVDLNWTVQVFPIPASQQLNIEISQPQTSISQVQIINGVGQIVFQQNDFDEVEQIDLSDWADGFYFLQVADKTGRTLNRKFIVQH